MLQYVTQDQIALVKDIGSIVGTASILYGLIRRAITTSRHKLNSIITENTNRVRDELTLHIDASFKLHETNAFARLAAQDDRIVELERHIADLDRQIRELVAVLRQGVKS
jgi:hypothetical protein